MAQVFPRSNSSAISNEWSNSSFDPRPVVQLRLYNIPTNIKIILNQRMAYATSRKLAEKLKLYTKYCLLVGVYFWRKRSFFFFGFSQFFLFPPVYFLAVNEQVSTANVIIDWDVKIIMNSEWRSQKHAGWWSANDFDLHLEGAKIEHWPENWLYWKIHRHPLSLHAYAEMVPRLGQHRFLPRTFHVIIHQMFDIIRFSLTHWDGRKISHKNNAEEHQRLISKYSIKHCCCCCCCWKN